MTADSLGFGAFREGLDRHGFSAQWQGSQAQIKFEDGTVVQVLLSTADSNVILTWRKYAFTIDASGSSSAALSFLVKLRELCLELDVKAQKLIKEYDHC
jgi:hypothetical protein